MADQFVDDTGIALSRTANTAYTLEVSSMGAATSISIKFSSNDETTYTEDRAVTAIGIYDFRKTAATHVKLVGTGGTDYVAYLNQRGL